MKFNYIHHIQISINSVTLIVTLPSVTMSDALLLVTLIVTLLSVTMSDTLLLVTLIVSTACRFNVLTYMMLKNTVLLP